MENKAATFRVTSFYMFKNSSFQRREEGPGKEAFERRLECGEA